jgi:hypothetical protein
MRKLIVGLAALAMVALGGTAALASGNPNPGQGKATACAALEQSQHSTHAHHRSGPPEDNNGTSQAETVLGCQDSD